MDDDTRHDARQRHPHPRRDSVPPCLHQPLRRSVASSLRRFPSAFTLLEVLVAMTILSVGILGIVTAVTMGVRVSGGSARLDRATAIAQAELAVAVSERADQLVPGRGSEGLFRWERTYVERSEGLMQARVVVTWPQRGVGQRYELARLFLPRP